MYRASVEQEFALTCPCVNASDPDRRPGDTVLGKTFVLERPCLGHNVEIRHHHAAEDVEEIRVRTVSHFATRCLRHLAEIDKSPELR